MEPGFLETPVWVLASLPRLACLSVRLSHSEACTYMAFRTPFLFVFLFLSFFFSSFEIDLFI